MINLNRMTELQKEYCEEKGLIYIKPANTEIADYVNWLETQIQALRIHDVVGQSEQLLAYTEWLKKEGLLNATVSRLIVKKYICE